MDQYYKSKSILHQTTCIKTPQQNAIAERKHQHILNVARALLFQSNLPKSFQTFSIIHAVFPINRLVTPLFQEKSPFELLYLHSPNYLQLKVFGSLCYASTFVAGRSKFDPKAKRCLFVGYKDGTKGYMVMDLNSREVFVFRNVSFQEHIFSYFNLSFDLVPQLVQSSIEYHDLSIVTNFDATPHIPFIQSRFPTRQRRALVYLQDYQLQYDFINSWTDSI